MEYGYLNMIEGKNINNNNSESSQTSNEFSNKDYKKNINMNLYNKENKVSNNINIEDYDNGRDIFYKKKTNRNKNDFLKVNSYSNKQLKYSNNHNNHNSNINIHNKNNINEFSEYDNNKEELFKKYETINNKEKYNINTNIINPNIDLNNKIMNIDDDNYLIQKNNKIKNNIINSNENSNEIDSMNDNNDDNIDNLDYVINKNNSKIFRSKVLNNNEYNNSINKYKNEINKLKKEIQNLENSNDILSNQLKEEEKRNEELNIIKNEKEENDNSILMDISHCLQVDSFDEIIPKLTEMINYLNKYNNEENAKIKEDLISKLKSLYIATTDYKDSKDNISIQDLWRWIKQLINNVKQLSIEKEKNEEIYKKNNYEIYKKYCEKLIKEFGLNSFDELKFFINDLLTKNNINKKRVEKLRKVLMNNNEKEDYSSSGYFNNEDNENDYENNMINANDGINGNNNNATNKKYNFKYH